MALRKDLHKYLQYVINTGGNATVVRFDDDWEPIGPVVRAELMPDYIIENDGRLVLTDEGHAVLGAQHGP